MRKLLIALAMIGASVFIAVPAVAQDEAAGPSESGTSDENIPEETPSQEPPAENPLIPQDSEDEETEPETAVKKLADGDVGALAQDPDKVRNITICHRTNSNNNPYNEITVSAFSIVKNNGHDTHNGPVWDPTLKDQGIKWGDIIPEFDYSEGHYDGQNLDAGSGILENGCLVDGEEPGDDDDDGDDDDGDDDGDDDEKEKSELPNTGGPSPWILLTGGLLSVLGVAILSNGSMMSAQAAGRHIKL